MSESRVKLHDLLAGLSVHPFSDEERSRDRLVGVIRTSGGSGHRWRVVGSNVSPEEMIGVLRVQLELLRAEILGDDA